jgi:hypothetical protein
LIYSARAMSMAGQQKIPSSWRPGEGPPRRKLVVLLWRRAYCARRGSAGGNSLADQAAASFPARRMAAPARHLDALRGRLGACEGASTSQAHAVAVVTEAAGAARSAAALTTEAVRTAARWRRRRFWQGGWSGGASCGAVEGGDERRERHDDGGVSGDAASEALTAAAIASAVTAVAVGAAAVMAVAATED